MYVQVNHSCWLFIKRTKERNSLFDLQNKCSIKEIWAVSPCMKVFKDWKNFPNNQKCYLDKVSLNVKQREDDAYETALA